MTRGRGAATVGGTLPARWVLQSVIVQTRELSSLGTQLGAERQPVLLVTVSEMSWARQVPLGASSPCSGLYSHSAGHANSRFGLRAPRPEHSGSDRG